MYKYLVLVKQYVNIMSALLYFYKLRYFIEFVDLSNLSKTNFRDLSNLSTKLLSDKIPKSNCEVTNFEMEDDKQATPTIRSKLVFIDFTGFTASSEHICQRK